MHGLQHQQPRISRADGTFAAILAPTRELAIQINDVLCQILRRYAYMVSGLLIGGENRCHEKARLRKGVTVLVASPGRLLDHLQNTASFKIGDYFLCGVRLLLGPLFEGEVPVVGMSFGYCQQAERCHIG